MSNAIFSLIPRVMAEIGAIGKNQTNDHQKYKFRGIEDMYNAAHPALIKHGVFCAPVVLDSQTFDIVSAQGKASYRVLLKVCHKFYGPDGSYVEVTTVGEGIDTSDKATNKAMSAAMKYAFIELFSIPTLDIEDSDRDSPPAGSTTPITPTPKQSVSPLPIKPGMQATGDGYVNPQVMGYSKLRGKTPEQFLSEAGMENYTKTVKWLEDGLYAQTLQGNVANAEADYKRLVAYAASIENDVPIGNAR